MEDFAAKEQKGIKEKSVYILHLDTPRIIIISCVIAGLLIISILIGMNINKLDPRYNESLADDTSALDNISGNFKSNNPENNNIDQGLNNENLFKNQENAAPVLSAENSMKTKDNIVNVQENPVSANVKESKETNNNTADILTHENIESIIPPVNAVKKPEIKKQSKKQREKRTEKRKGIVEVSEVSPKEKFNKSAQSDKSYFAVQVASFDKRSKAVAEINNLEKKKYSAYIDNAKVSDRTFYRVMIGPIYSKKKALDLMDEISADNRYAESYIIKK